MRKFLLLTACCALFSTLLPGQTQPFTDQAKLKIKEATPSAFSDSALQKGLRLKPLAALLTLAVEHSPLIKINGTAIAYEQVQETLERRSWADWVSVGAGSFYGNGAALNITNDQGVLTYLPTQRRSTSYNLSVNFFLPGGSLINRRQKNELARLAVQRKQEDRLDIERQVHLQVIEIYSRAETAVRMIEVKAQAVESLRMAAEVAEPFFRSGNLPANEYAELLDRLNQATDEFELHKGEAKRFCLLLREMVGAPVTE